MATAEFALKTVRIVTMTDHAVCALTRNASRALIIPTMQLVMSASRTQTQSSQIRRTKVNALVQTVETGFHSSKAIMTHVNYALLLATRPKRVVECVPLANNVAMVWFFSS